VRAHDRYGDHLVVHTRYLKHLGRADSPSSKGLRLF
jgi:hypothetical protein